MPTTTRAKGPAKEAPSWDLILKRNAIERHKKEKFPLDIIDELDDMIERGYEAIPEEDIVFLSWYGLMHDKPKIGTFMVRVKVPGGRITPDQLITLGRISSEKGRNYGELTTRQGIQLHWIELGELPEVLDAISSSGLTTTGGEGDTVRNVTGCPLAGVAADELFDVTGLIADVAAFFSGNRDYSDLPRKHKFTISACPAQCNAPEIHDVALIGTVKDGRNGFSLAIGGGLSATPRIAKDLGVFIPFESNEQIIEVLRAVTDVWQTNTRYRVSRVKARIKHMMDDYGPEAMRTMIEEWLGYAFEDGVAPEPVGDGSGHTGVHRQRRVDKSSVGVPVTMGRVTGDQLVALGGILAEIDAEARFTRSQNFIAVNVPNARVEWLIEQLEAIGFEPKRSNLYARSVACTDHQFCNYSVAETKGRLDQILPELERRFGADAVADLGIHMDGCPHACAHHWVGDIGLQGTTATNKETGLRTEAYNLRLRGRLGAGAAIGVPLLRRIPAHQIEEVVCRLVGAWVDAKRAAGAQLGFGDFLDRHDDDELRRIANGEGAIGGGERETAATTPLVRIPGMLLETTGGADLIEVSARTVGGILAELKRRFPELAAQTLDEHGAVIASVNVFVGEEDVRFLDGDDTPVAVGQELTILPALSGGC